MSAVPSDGTVQISLITAGCALIGALLGAAIAGFSTLRAKRNEYINDYFKLVIQKRIEAYEAVERVIESYKMSVADSDGQIYHWPFGSKDAGDEAFLKLGTAISKGLWLSERAADLLRELNFIEFHMPEGNRSLIAYGKKNYVKVAETREALERVMAKDMSELHNVRQFLAGKAKRHSGFVEIPPKEEHELHPSE